MLSSEGRAPAGVAMSHARHDIRGWRPNRIAIFRALKLGDMLCTLPALRAIRAAWTEAEIVLIALPWAKEFADRFSRYLDGFRPFPGFPGLPECPADIGRIPSFLAEMQAEAFDLAIQLHGSGRLTNPIVELFGARRCAGFFQAGEYCPDPHTFLPWPERGLEIRRLLLLTEFLGAPAMGEELELPLHPSDLQRLQNVASEVNLRPGTYVCIHPGASVPERRWPAERFAAVARTLARRGARIVLTGVAGEEPLARSVSRQLPGACLDLVGRTDLGSLGALLAGARLLVCNDTGVSHLADALRVPSVVISTGGNPDRWAPVNSRRHRVLCRPSGEVEVAEAVAAAEALLQSDQSHAGPTAPWLTRL